jgi:hypothetical protein
MVNALLILPAIILNIAGLPEVSRARPTASPLFASSEIFLI